MKLIGLDPGLGCTGWGVITAKGNSLSHIANGQIRTDAKASMSERLATLAEGLRAILAEHAPDEAGIEEVFVNTNAQSTLKLGQARGALMLVLADTGVPIGEYAARFVKKAVVGTGGADKAQIHAMVSVLLPGAKIAGADAADALAIAITHAHHRASARAVGAAA
ncbi:crossover junction endodeoxyribonuclease RuvC [Parasphingopyxis sp.]|uniref:crossover junction endodeoxyribonuclease RuvC n=1 Tax=Parasphingopyxis sp. TaxID=1920299 RepID=UPI00261D0EE8|nr:crossover junction endodeoxyribonuclease RuvC [Parasphingopyxis sp.]